MKRFFCDWPFNILHAIYCFGILVTSLVMLATASSSGEVRAASLGFSVLVAGFGSWGLILCGVCKKWWAGLIFNFCFWLACVLVFDPLGTWIVNQ